MGVWAGLKMGKVEGLGVEGLGVEGLGIEGSEFEVKRV